MEFSWAFFWKAAKLKIVVSPQCCFSWCIMQIQSGAWFRFSYSSLLIQGLCKVLALWYNEYFFPIWLLLTFTIRPSSCWAFGWFVIISQTCTSPVCWTLRTCPLLQGSLSLHSLSLLLEMGFVLQKLSSSVFSIQGICQNLIVFFLVTYCRVYFSKPGYSSLSYTRNHEVTCALSF